MKQDRLYLGDLLSLLLKSAFLAPGIELFLSLQKCLLWLVGTASSL